MFRLVFNGFRFRLSVQTSFNWDLNCVRTGLKWFQVHTKLFGLVLNGLRLGVPINCQTKCNPGISLLTTTSWFCATLSARICIICRASAKNARKLAHNTQTDSFCVLGPPFRNYPNLEPWTFKKWKLSPE